MADSTVSDISKMKVVDLRKELKSRGLSYAGDKAELVTRLQAAISQDDHGDINLDSDEIDSDVVLEDEDDKSQADILEDSAVDTLNEELVLADHPSPEKIAAEVKPPRILKRKITTESSKDKDVKSNESKEGNAKKIVLNRAVSITVPVEPPEEKIESKPCVSEASDSNKVKITAEVDAKTRLELRAKRFGLPVKMTDAERKEARKQRFGHNTSVAAAPSFKASIQSDNPGTLSENLEKLKQRAERFGQSVSKIMTDIENKEKLEKRKAKFGTVA